MWLNGFAKQREPLLGRQGFKHEFYDFLNFVEFI